MTFTTLIFVLIALLLGMLITFLIFRVRYSSVREDEKHYKIETENLLKQLNDKEEEIKSMTESNQSAAIEKSTLQKELEFIKGILKENESKQSTQINELQRKTEEQSKTISQIQAEHESSKKELQLTKEKIDEKNKIIASKEAELLKLSSTIEQQRESNSKIIAQRDTAIKEVELLNEQIRRNEEDRSKVLNQQLEMAKEQLQNATQEILKQREESLNKANNEQMGNVVMPLKEQLEAIQRQVTETIKTTTDNKASIEKAIEELMKRTLEIGNDANNLARALKNESKTQGNWGELILEKLLESAGLQEGTHYDRQSTLKDGAGRPVSHDETGKRLIPDIIIHYPDGKDCIIDSKVSLSDYLDYCNAETDDQREQAIKRHLVSVRKHVKELAGKDYSSYIQPPHQRLNYTIMFVPNEFAMQLALQNDRQLWREAFDKGVFITSEQNLLALLRMIQIAWTQVQQARNQQEVIDQARKLLDRISDFVERFDKVGDQIQKVSDSFSSAKDKLYNGQQSIIKAAKDMEKLGYRTSPKRQIPEAIDWKN